MVLIDSEVRNAVITGLALALQEAQKIDIPFEQAIIPGGEVGFYQHLGGGNDPVSGKQLFSLTFVFVTEDRRAAEAIDRRIVTMGGGEWGDSPNEPQSS